jgi:DNA polymerase-3 subunit delta'
MSPLAHGWRQIVGHDWAVGLLAGSLAQDRVGHAYLITGPDHVGKTTLARAFAQALNCEAAVGERPCGRCRACGLIASDKHPDVRLVRPEVNERGTAALKIEAIRALQQDLSLSAYEARTKVAILKQFDVASLGATNAFLKTLEEPPANVVLLLTAADAETLLPTVSSRCRTLALRPVSAGLIEETLITRHHVPPGLATLLSRLADGRLGWAVAAHRNPALLEERAAQLEQLDRALAGNRVDRFALAESLSRKPEALPPMLRNWLSWWRDVVLLSHSRSGTAAITNVDHADRLHDLARSWPRAEALKALAVTGRTVWQLEHNANTRLALEAMFLSYPRAARAA